MVNIIEPVHLYFSISSSISEQISLSIRAPFTTYCAYSKKLLSKCTCSLLLAVSSGIVFSMSLICWLNCKNQASSFFFRQTNNFKFEVALNQSMPTYMAMATTKLLCSNCSLNLIVYIKHNFVLLYN